MNRNGVIVVGHGRYEAFRQFGEKLGLKPIWVIDDVGQTIMGAPETTPMTDDQEKTYRLADNKLNESVWRMDLVFEELKMLSPQLIDLTGFDRADLEGKLSADQIDELARERDIDLGKYNVITVEAPEAPRLKARMSFYFDEIGDFNKVKDFFKLKGGELDTNALLGFVKKQ